MRIKNPHDLFFKETFGNVTVAGDFLTNYLPTSVNQHIDIDTLDPQKDSFIDEKLKESFSDLLFKVNIAGNEGYIYFLFEHKSYPDRGIAFQVLKYMVDIWESKMDQDFGELPIVIPLVVYHGKSNWRIPSSLGSILNGYEHAPEELKTYVPNFEYLLYDLTGYSDEEIKGAVQTRIALTLLRDIFSTNKEKLLNSLYRSVEFLNELEDKQTGIEYFETMIHYIIGSKTQLTKNDMEEMIQKIESIFPEGSELSMSLADILREEGFDIGLKKGIEEGLEKGLEEGLEKGLVDMTSQGLIAKFKKVPADITENIQHADIAVLKTILLKLMSDDSFKDINEVREYL